MDLKIMKKLLILLLFPFTSFSQDLVLKNEESKTIMNPSVYQNITMEGNASLYVLDKLYATNLNLNGNNKIVVYTQGALSLNSSINLNSTDSLINNGFVKTSNVEIQGFNSYIKNNGKFEVYSGDLQINHQTGVLENHGEIKISNWFNINNGKYISKSCGFLHTNGINVNVSNSISGNGGIYFNSQNINQILTQSDRIYVYYMGTFNNKNVLGKAILNDPVGCKNDPLPVKIVSTKFTKKGDGIDCYIEFTQESTQIGFIVQESEDEGKTWRSVIYPVKTTKDSNKYTYHYRPE